VHVSFAWPLAHLFSWRSGLIPDARLYRRWRADGRVRDRHRRGGAVDSRLLGAYQRTGHAGLLHLKMRTCGGTSHQPGGETRFG